MMYHVKDLSPEQKRAAEILLGHSVSEHESVTIRSIDPAAVIPSRLSAEERMEALKSLNDLFARRDINCPDSDEEEAACNEALRSVRPGYRPVG
jgi:hypothetical protein